MWNLRFLPLLLAACVAGQAPVLEIISQCETGSAVMTLMAGLAIPSGVGERTLTDVTLEQCSKICIENKSPDSIVECSAFTYVKGGGVCVLFASYKKADLIPDPASDVYQKTCVDSVKICNSPFTFESIPGKILVGFARDVVAAESIEQCFSTCLNSVDDHGFECQSAMYYPTDQECILNTENRRGSPGAFVDEPKDSVIYVDNNCAGSTCFSPYVTQYVSIRNRVLVGQRDVVIPNTNADHCAQLCTNGLTNTGEPFMCKSYWTTLKKECVLSDETAMPSGRAEIVEEAGAVYYEKKCLSAKETCRNSPAYERVPGMVLVGFAAYVLENIPSVSQCLDYCSSPPPEQTEDGFVCESVVYYYTEQECIMNVGTKDTNPEVFVPEGKGFNVDYFQPTCERKKEVCKSGKPTMLRYQGYTLGPVEKETTLIKEMKGTAQECLIACYESAPMKCRGFNMVGEMCQLLILSPTCSTNALDLADDDSTSAYQLMCLDGADLHSKAYNCELGSQRTGIPMKTIAKPLGLQDCLSRCLKTEGCNGINYKKNMGQCEMYSNNKANVDVNDAYDYCEVAGEVKPVKPDDKNTKIDKEVLEDVPNGIQTVCNFDGMKVVYGRDKPFSGSIFVKNKYQSCRVEVEDRKSAVLSLGFPPGVTQVGGPQPPKPGAPGVGPPGAAPPGINEPGFGPRSPSPNLRRKRQFPAGGAIIRQPNVQRFAEGGPALKAPPTAAKIASTLPPQRDCGLQDLGDGKFQTTVVIQDNNLGIPGLVTSSDKIYTVTCDYGKIIHELSVAKAELKLTGPEPTNIKPRGKIEMSTPIMMQMLGADSPEPVLQADIGDILELNWEMMAIDEELDFFVRECIAEQGGPNGQHLKLMERGCPVKAVAGKIMPEAVKKNGKLVKSTKIQAFRFDGSRTVRIVCQLDICSGECNPADCEISGKDVESLGRKKRDLKQENEITDGQIETAKYKIPRRTKAMTSFVVVDPLMEEKLHSNFHQAKHQSVNVLNTSTFEEAEAEVVLSEKGRVCLPRSTFVGVFLFLGMLALVQAGVVGAYVTKRLIY